ncbi:MAG: peptide chain release factor 1 [Gluconacetobacter diazotrophicus]|nr:peptide chain release factor 1 [Gluconacetobacter diazotrophicus]
MDDQEYHAKLDELDHLLNDDDDDGEPGRIWDLLAAVSHHDLHHNIRG